MKKTIFYKLFLKRKIQEKNILKRQDILLRKLKYKIKNEYMLFYIDLVLDTKSVLGREENIIEIMAYCIQNNLDYFVEELFKTQIFLENKRYNNEQKLIFFMYAYYLEMYDVYDKRLDKYKQKALYRFKIKNINKYFSKFNKIHHKSIKKIVHHKKKDIDTKKFEIMNENLEILVEAMEHIYKCIVFNKKINKLAFKEIERINELIIKEDIIINKNFYFEDKETEKTIKRINFASEIGMIIVCILLVILAVYNMIIFS